MELVAFARLNQVDIAVHQAYTAVWIVKGSDWDPSDPEGSNHDNKSKPTKPSRLLHIVYHSWEHYSSVRMKGEPPNTSGGPPTIIIKPTHVDPLPERDPNDPPSGMEKMIMSSTHVHDLQRIRKMLKEARGDPGRVMDVLFEEAERESERLAEEEAQEKVGQCAHNEMDGNDGSNDSNGDDQCNIRQSDSKMFDGDDVALTTQKMKPSDPETQSPSLEGPNGYSVEAKPKSLERTVDSDLNHLLPTNARIETSNQATSLGSSSSSALTPNPTKPKEKKLSARERKEAAKRQRKEQALDKKRGNTGSTGTPMNADESFKGGKEMGGVNVNEIVEGMKATFI
jgi:hypothetical protein